MNSFSNQVDISREPANRVRGSWGNVMYSAKMFRDNIQGTVDFFANYIYSQPALQPEYHWLAANTSSSSTIINAPKIKVFVNGRLYVNLDKMTESSLIHRIAIYKSQGNGFVLFKVLPTEGPATDLDTGLELEKGYYAATLVDRFGREGMKSYFEL